MAREEAYAKAVAKREKRVREQTLERARAMLKARGYVFTLEDEEALFGIKRRKWWQLWK